MTYKDLAKKYPQVEQAYHLKDKLTFEAAVMIGYEVGRTNGMEESKIIFDAVLTRAQAVNSHDEMLEALKSAHYTMKDVEGWLPPDTLTNTLDVIERAIAKAEGKEP